MESNFWQIIKKPIIGLAPMDGATDQAFRFIADKYGSPDIMFTEFVPAEAISFGSARVLSTLSHNQTKTPTIAQLFGSDPHSFYIGAIVAFELGFDGIDINMGCPDKQVTKKGGGASLILNPQLACQIIKETKKAALDWFEGIDVNAIGIKADILSFISKSSHKRRLLPVSIKTRLGYDKIITEEWISSLLEAEPACISLHGRTFREMYSGTADWEEIAKAAELVHKTKTIILGNGDIKSIAEAKQRIKDSKVDGVLIGRAALGNPWIFAGKKPLVNERFRVMVEHCNKFTQFRPSLKLLPMRKHLSWYCKDFSNAARVRADLMRINTVEDVKYILEQIHLRVV